MHTRSKRYLRRQRARMRVTRRRPDNSSQYENKFAAHVEAGLRKSWEANPCCRDNIALKPACHFEVNQLLHNGLDLILQSEQIVLI